MIEPFCHLRVVSGYSMRHGTDSPAALVGRAVELGMDALALTDRDGLYGAVKHVTACQDAGIAPLLGVDLAVAGSGLITPAGGAPTGRAPTGRTSGRGSGGRALLTGTRTAPARATPARGGAVVDPRLPRVTVLAHAGGTGERSHDGPGNLPDGAGYAALCRLVSATHLAGERGTPVSTLELIAEHAVDPASGLPALTVLLGPSSEVGRAVLARRDDLARAVLARWYDALPLGSAVVEVVCHLGADGTPASAGHAARTLALAREAGLPAVLTNAVRHARPEGASIADVLDAARRLVPLHPRHLDRTTGEGHLKGTAEMVALAERVSDAAGTPASGLLAATADLARRCRLDPARDLGLGQVHLPEPEALGLAPGTDVDALLRARCEAGVGRRYPGAGEGLARDVRRRLTEELSTIASLGYATYFLTVAGVCDLVRERGVRVAARGSGAGSLVNHLLGISGVEPMAHGLLMERFLTTTRAQLPDIDLDVESARRTEVYEAIIARFGGDRVAAVSMMDTYRVRHAVRDVGAALGMPATEVDAIAKAFPHIRARDVRAALADLPELRASGFASPRLDQLYDLVERLDGLPRHIALHPCGVLLSDGGLLGRTPVEASWLGFPMSQYDKEDVETLGLLKLDVLGIRMQSAMAHAVQEVTRLEREAGVAEPEVIELDAVPLDDEDAFRLIRSTRTLGCFQIESPGQRELVGKFAPQDFSDLVVDISLFRPGPVKSDMISPFLAARQGWAPPDFLHERLRPALEETEGVVVFHEQVMRIVAITAGVSLTEADEVRRSMGSHEAQAEVEGWWRPRALERGFAPEDVDRIWEVLRAFASFGFCKAHAAAFALPTYQSAWLKAHHPAAFLSGVLTHDPGMYPKRLILDDARQLGIVVLGLDVNLSGDVYRVERVERVAREDAPGAAGRRGGLDQQPLLEGESWVGASRSAPVAGVGRSVPRPGYRVDAAVPDARGWGIRMSLAEVKGISAAEVQQVVAGQPYRSLGDFWTRARVSRPVVERLVVAGAFDDLYGFGDGRPAPGAATTGQPTTGQATTGPATTGPTRRDLLLQLVELERWSRSVDRGRGRTTRSATPRTPAPDDSASGTSASGTSASGTSVPGGSVAAAAARQSRAPAQAVSAQDRSAQLTLDLGDSPQETVASGLPEMTSAERVRAELEVLGLDASRHVLDFYAPLLTALGVTRSPDLVSGRSGGELLVAGVKVATQTPPIRSGRRVVFLTLDDATGPVDATFFEDAQGPYAATVFGSWLLLVRGELRRTGPRGVSLRATGAWDLAALWEVWAERGTDAVRRLLVEGTGYDERALEGAAASRSSRPVLAPVPRAPAAGEREAGDRGAVPSRIAGSRTAGPGTAGSGTAPAGVVGTGRDDGAVPGLDSGRSGPQERAAAAARREGEARRQEHERDRQERETRERAARRRAPGGGGGVGGGGGGFGERRVLVHASGFRQSPYTDVRPVGGDVRSTRSMVRSLGAATPDPLAASPSPSSASSPTPAPSVPVVAPAVPPPDGGDPGPGQESADGPRPTTGPGAGTGTGAGSRTGGGARGVPDPGTGARGPSRKLWHSSAGSSGR